MHSFYMIKLYFNFFQNSKYGGSKSSYSSERSYGHDRMRDSPNGNSYRSDSPDSQSPRDRSYQNKSSYLQKIRDKERDSRDYKSRDKYSGEKLTAITNIYSFSLLLPRLLAAGLFSNNFRFGILISLIPLLFGLFKPFECMYNFWPLAEVIYFILLHLLL